MKKNEAYSHLCEFKDLMISKSEILRYMNCEGDTEAVTALMDSCLKEAAKAITPRGSFAYYDVCITGGITIIDNTEIHSENLSKTLSDCSGVIVASLTLGTGFDFLLRRYSSLVPSRALCIDAIGTAATEAYAEKICNDLSLLIKEDNLYTRPRFSPGYGDFSLKYQEYILKLSNGLKLNGITLTDSLLMIPTKSVTAIIGVSHEDSNCHMGSCEICNKQNCKYKR